MADKKNAVPAKAVEVEAVEGQKIEDIMAVLNSATRSSMGARAKNRTFEIRIGSMEVNFAPQCRQVLSVLLMLAVDDEGQIKPSTLVKELDICKVMEENASEFQTVQGPWKLFQYYRKALVDAGWLKEVADEPKPVAPESK